MIELVMTVSNHPVPRLSTEYIETATIVQGKDMMAGHDIIANPAAWTISSEHARQPNQGRHGSAFGDRIALHRY